MVFSTTFELSKKPLQIDKLKIRKRLGAVILTNTHLIDVKNNNEYYSIPLQQINEIRFFDQKLFGNGLIKIMVALILICGPLAIITYMLWYITDFWKKLFQADHMYIWVILLPCLAILSCGVSLLLDFINYKKYIKVEIHAANTRRMLYFNRKQISQQEVNSLLQDIKAAMDSAPVSHHEQGN